MSSQMTSTKDLIIEAAITLFNAHGFQGTAIRDIAKKAKVNPATISYYFQGKQGLLEACLVKFFEPYLKCLDEETKKLDTDDANICLNRSIKKVLYFQSENHLLTRVVWREVTIDSQVSREIISSYLMKEKFFFKSMIDAALKQSKTVYPISMFIIQLKGMLTMPYLNSQYVGEVWGTFPQEPFFAEKYYTAIQGWLDTTLGGDRSEFASNHIYSNVKESV